MVRSTALSLYLLATRSDLPSDRAEKARRDWPDRPAGALVWFHTGRAAPPRPVVELTARLAAERPGLEFLITTSAPGTVTRAFEGGTITAAPEERQGSIATFLDHWRPAIGIWTECDLRPAMISQAARAGTPLFMIDAGTARATAGALRWRRGMTRALLAEFSGILAADPAALSELRRMGAPPGRLEMTGRLEEGSAALACNEAERAAMAEVISGRPVWLAAGVLEEEAAAAAAAHRRLLAHAHRLLLVMVPDDPAQGPAFAARLRADGWEVGLRSDGDDPEPTVQVYIADTEGEYGIWYRLAPVSFMGASLTRGSGRNPFEAAALGSAVLHGPHVGEHRDAYARLAAAGAARLVRDADALFRAVDVLQSPEAAAQMARAAWAVCSAGAEVTDRVIALVLDTLDGETPG